MAEKYGMEKKLKDLGVELYIQGEICGPGIQGNKYGFKEKKFFIFNVYLLKEQRFMSYLKMESLAEELRCEVVPLVSKMANVKTVEDAVEWSQGESIFNGTMPREGIVVRSLALNTKRSVKVINPEFLLKYKE
jgi:ATP-dependent RNA circularization protein (DNA/RNA ligase family)